MSVRTFRQMSGPQHQLQSAWGTSPTGERVQVQLPAWAKANAFWGAWEACHHLSATADVADSSDRAPQKVTARQLTGARAGSTIEERAILETQMRLGAETVPKLAAAQLVLCDPDRAGDWTPFQAPAEAAAWAAFVATLPYDPMFLDFTTADHRRAIAMDMGAGRAAWQMSAALVEHVGSTLAVTVFGAPSDQGAVIDEPPSVPQGRVLFGATPSLPAPRVGEVAVDAITGQTYTTEIRDPDSQIIARVSACFFLSVGVLACLRHLLSADVDLRPALSNPKARRQSRERGERMPLMPVRSS
jgi:hypothetical protein